MGDEKPVIDALTGAKSLPMNERLKLLDKEIRRLHTACVDAGYDPDKVREVASPVLKVARKGKVKKVSRTLLYLLIAACVCGGLYYNSTSNFVVSVVVKKFLVYWVLPHYDWTWMFDSECLIKNPYFEPEVNELTEDNCTLCANITELLPMTEVDSDEMADLIFKFQPAIISDAMSDWKAVVENATLDTFIKLYATDERTMNTTGELQTTHFRTTKTIPLEIKNVTSLAKWLYNEGLEGRKPNFTAQWSNINSGSYKALHYYYSKPYFLPNMCEALRSMSYIMMARMNDTNNKKGLLFRPRFDEMGMWIAQIYGRYDFVLSPVKMCNETCPKLKFVLKQGEILNIPIGLYDVAYRPNSTEAVGIGIGYTFQ